MSRIVQALSAGSNAAVGNGGLIEISVEWANASADLDISCFMVNEKGVVPSDEYFIFYNQPSDPSHQVEFTRTQPTFVKFSVKLDELDAKISKCVFAATLGGSMTFESVEGCKVTVKSADTEISYEIKGVKDETSLVLLELYRHQSSFKVRAIGRGFNGGLKPLAEAHGVNIEDPIETPAPPAVEAAPTLPLTKIDLLKKTVKISLEKKNLMDAKARVAIIIDASGSMRNLFSNGTVQRAFEKVLAIAACMDSDGTLDVWFFGTSSMRAPSVTERDFEDYVTRVHPRPGAPIGFDNNEPVVMEDVIKKYTKEEPADNMPTYVIFFSDGGIDKTKAISKLLVDSSTKNIFWQFIGLGNANFGVLEELDDLKGRFVDNADFFSLSNLESVSDEELYNKMFDEYPSWLTEARSKGILKD